MYTLVKIKYKHYNENVWIDSKKKEKELMEIKNTHKDFEFYKVIQQGNYRLKYDRIEIKEFAMGNNDEFEFMQIFEIAGGKVKAIIDTFGEDYRMCFQKVKTTSKGQWVNVYGSKIYFLNGITL